MLRSLSALLFILSTAVAAQDGYRVDCLPDLGDPLLLDRVSTRLALRGWVKADAKGQVNAHICFRIKEQPQLRMQSDFNRRYYDPYGFRVNAPPQYALDQVKILELTVTRANGLVWSSTENLGYSPPSDTTIDDAVRTLIDRLPFPTSP